MTALTLYQIEERIQDRRTSFASSPDLGPLRDLLAEIVAVIAGSVLPLGKHESGLSAPLRRDLGLD